MGEVTAMGFREDMERLVREAWSDVGNTYQAVLTQDAGWHARPQPSLCDGFTQGVAEGSSTCGYDINEVTSDLTGSQERMALGSTRTVLTTLGSVQPEASEAKGPEISKPDISME